MLKRISVVIAALTFLIVLTVAFFQDNVCRLMGMSSDALSGDDNIAQRQMPVAGNDVTLTKKTMKNFGSNDTSQYCGSASPVYRSEPITFAPSGNTSVHVDANRTTDTHEDALSTFAVDVDTASYTLARAGLEKGYLPQPDSVRVEEWVNAFHYSLPEPKDAPFGISVEGAPSPFTGGRTLLKVALKGREVANADRLPANLVLLVDTSCSMSGPERIGLAKQSLSILVKNLNARDTVGIVTYAGSVKEVLEPTPATDRQRILDAIDSLTTAGGTSMGSGMEIAYRWAARKTSNASVSRVIVFTDGDANIGRNLTADQMLASVHGYVKEGVLLTTVGFGMGNYRDSLLEKLADSGNGQAVYIDSEREARKVFQNGIAGTLETIAKDVKVQVAFDPKIVETYRLVGYENRAVADKDFRNDEVDGGEIGAGHRVTALYELLLRPGAKGALANIAVRGQRPRGGPAFEVHRSVTRADLATTLADSSTELRFAAAVAGTADILRGNGAASDFSLRRALELAQASTNGFAERVELVGLIRRAIALRDSGGAMAARAGRSSAY